MKTDLSGRKENKQALTAKFLALQYPLQHNSETRRQQIESAMRMDDVERARVEANQQARDDAEAARQPPASGFKNPSRW